MHDKLWLGSDLERILACDGGLQGGVSGISIDSRSLEPGDLFFALSGAPDARYFGAGGSGRDGHDFVAAAKAAGAAAAVVSRRVEVDLPQLLVADTFDALWQLAAAARDRYQGPVLAVTGSSGKTTAKAMLAAALPGCHAAAGSFNNHLGVPLSLARLPLDASAGVFEVGMNSPGEIAPLARLLRPDVALVLNVLPVHLAGLGSLEAIRREKLSLAEGLPAGGILVLPDDLDSSGSPEGIRHVTFGSSATADVRLIEEGGSATITLGDGRRLPLTLVADGPHRRLTATAVIATLFAAGFDPAAGLARLADLPPPTGRGGRIEVAGICIIDDSYNANPSSVRFALQGLREQAARRRFALLGDMLELGSDAGRLHRELAAHCAGIDAVFCVGEHMAELQQALPEGQRGGHWPDCEQLDLKRITASLQPGDVLLVKASNRLFWQAGTVAALRAQLATRAADEADQAS